MGTIINCQQHNNLIKYQLAYTEATLGSVNWGLTDKKGSHKITLPQFSIADPKIADPIF